MNAWKECGVGPGRGAWKGTHGRKHRGTDTTAGAEHRKRTVPHLDLAGWVAALIRIRKEGEREASSSSALRQGGK